MSFTPIFSSLGGIIGGLAGGVVGYGYDVVNRCGIGATDCPEEHLASDVMRDASVDKAFSDIFHYAACDPNDNSFICDVSTAMNLMYTLTFGIQFLKYYPMALSCGVVGASLGAAIGSVLDCCVDNFDDQKNISKFKYR